MSYKHQILFSLENLIDDVISEVRPYISKTFNDLIENKLRDRVMLKVINWENVYVPDSNLYSKFQKTDEDDFIMLCKEITKNILI